MFLHSKEEWIFIISTKLQEVKPAYNKRQNTITTNWKSNQQAQKCKILQYNNVYRSKKVINRK